MPRCVDAKRQSLYKAAVPLRSEAAKQNCNCEAKSLKGIVLIREFNKLFSLLTKRKLFTLAPTGRESGCFNHLITTTREGNKQYKNTDRATECAMTNVGANLLKITRHSEDNNFLSPKNLLKGLQEDLSLNAQDDENDFLTETFLSRPLRERRNFLANVSELRNFRDKGNRRALAMRVTLSALAEGGN